MKKQNTKKQEDISFRSPKNNLFVYISLYKQNSNYHSDCIGFMNFKDTQKFINNYSKYKFNSINPPDTIWFQVKKKCKILPHLNICYSTSIRRLINNKKQK